MPMTFDEIVHAERGRLLEKLPKGAEVFCSAGCSGSWYFDWVEKHYGPVAIHYGIELFSPKPAGLPRNVVWFQNSVSDMKDVPTGSVDILFSGQNIEHLYFSDIVGFFKEASRVVKAGGHICIDSPNRLVTQEVGYTQPQHVLEFSQDDVVRLLEAAGFKITAIDGIWSSKFNGRTVSDITEVTSDHASRIRDGGSDPENAFIWWAVAQKVSDDVTRVEAVADAIATSRFPSFVRNRFRKSLGDIYEIEGTEAVIKLDSGDRGFVFYGPYVPLRAGRYEVSFTVKFLAESGPIKVDVVSQFGAVTHGEALIEAVSDGSWHTEKIVIAVADYTEGVETRLYSDGASALVRFGTQILRQ